MDIRALRQGLESGQSARDEVSIEVLEGQNGKLLEDALDQERVTRIQHGLPQFNEKHHKRHHKSHRLMKSLIPLLLGVTSLNFTFVFPPESFHLRPSSRRLLLVPRRPLHFHLESQCVSS